MILHISLYNTEIYLDEYTALMSVLDEPLGESNTDIKAVYESKYISVLYSEMLNDLFILYLDIFFFSNLEIFPYCILYSKRQNNHDVFDA